MSKVKTVESLESKKTNDAPTCFMFYLPMPFPDEDCLEHFRVNLPTIRKLLGWSSETLADRLGRTRANVCNIENKPGKLDAITYFALWTVIWAAVEGHEIESDIFEMGNKARTKALIKTIDILTDWTGDNYTDEEVEDIRKVVRDCEQTTSRRLGTEKVSEKALDILASRKE